jgi:hypothetical protein
MIDSDIDKIDTAVFESESSFSTGVFTMSDLDSESEIPTLDSLVSRRFYPELKKAVFHEILVNRHGYASFRGRDDFHLFIDGVVKNMGIPNDWIDSMDVRDEFESLIFDAIRDFQQIR